MSLLVALGVGLMLGSVNKVALAKQGEITWWIWHWDSPEQMELWTEITESFGDQTGIAVNIQTVQWNEISKKLAVASSAGNPPDVVMLLNWDYNWVQAAGYLADITSRAEKELDLDDFRPLDELKVDGKLYALPWRREVKNVFYNAAVLREVGITAPPNTMAEAKQYAERVTKAVEGVYGWGMCAGLASPLAHRFESILYSYGGEWLNKNGTDVAPSFEEAAANTYKFYQDMAKSAPPSALSDTDDDVGRLAAAGKIAMWIDSMCAIPQLENLCPEEVFKHIRYGVIPEGKYDPETNKSYRYSSVTGWNIQICAGSRNPEAAWEFVKFWTSSENMVKAVQTLPGRKSSMRHPRFDKIPEAFKLVGIKSTLTAPWRTEIADFIHETTQRIILGQVSSEEAAKLTVEKVRELLH